MRNLRIKNLRIDNDLTQEYVSKKLNINRRTYADYENLVNDVPIDVFVKIALFYDVSMQYLANLTNEKHQIVSLKSFNYDKVLSNIVKLREENKLTQEKLASKIHCSNNTLSQYETGKRKLPLQILIQLTDVFNKSLDEICM